ncbi:MAG: lysylphosphatidylglycerol synthase transmembrane domain-containing protein [Rubrivivax sp.]
MSGWRLAAAPLLLAAVFWLAGPAEVWGTLRGADAGWLAAGLACAFAANLVSALRWRALCAWMRMVVTPRWAVVTYFRGVALNVALPGAVVGGDVLRASALQRQGHPGAPAAMSVLGDRVSGLWMLVALGLAALASGLDSPQWQLFVARWPALAPLGSRPLLLGLLAVFVALPWIVLRTAGASAAMLQHPKAAQQYAAQVLLSLAVQALSVGALGCAAAAVGAPLAPWALAAAAVPIFLMATLPVSFGGWGTREAAAAICLVPLGVAPAQAVTLSVIYGLYPVVQAAVALASTGGGAKPPR